MPWWYIGLHDLIVLLTNTLLPKEQLDILDVGCGTGGLLSIFNQTGHKTEGLDHSEDALFFCHERGLEHVFKADVNDWIPNSNSYDLIISLDVLCHEWVHDEIKVLRSMAHGLKNTGLLMLNYPAFPILKRHHDSVVMIQRRYTKESLKKILLEAGLSPVLISYRLPHAFIYLLLLRIYENGKRSNAEEKSDIADINRCQIEINSSRKDRGC